MGFETGDLEDPYGEDDGDDEDSEIESEIGSEAGTETSRSSSATNIEEESSSLGESDPTDPVDQYSETPYIKEIDPTKPISVARLSRALMVPEYHRESPPVPYTLWREGTSTGRTRTTIELNSDVDALVRKGLNEFNNRYDTDIRKADIRELALAYGLTHLDEVFEMAEEWGLQYND